MRRLKKLAALVVLALCLAPLLALAAGGITLNTATRVELTDCASTGSSASTLYAGSYLFRVTTEDVWVCLASTCTGTSGEKFPAGMSFLWVIQATTQVSCRSAASTGDAIFTNGG